MEKRYQIHSLEEMNQFAKKMIPFCFPGSIIGLEGDLGSGKTTFTKFLAQHLGIDETVNSPTFTILKVYPGKMPLYHMDVYRLEGIGYDYELDDFIYGEGVSVIEWYPYIETMLPEDILKIIIIMEEDGSRTMVVRGSGVYEEILQKISD